MHPAFGGFMNDPTAQMGFAMGKNMAAAGQEYVEQNVRSSLQSYPMFALALQPSDEGGLQQA